MRDTDGVGGKKGRDCQHIDDYSDHSDKENRHTTTPSCGSTIIVYRCRLLGLFHLPRPSPSSEAGAHHEQRGRRRRRGPQNPRSPCRAGFVLTEWWFTDDDGGGGMGKKGLEACRWGRRENRAGLRKDLSLEGEGEPLSESDRRLEALVLDFHASHSHFPAYPNNPPPPRRIPLVWARIILLHGPYSGP